MTPSLRRFVLAVHVAVSVGWLGAIGAYLALAIAGLASRDLQLVRGAYLSMDLVVKFVIVPCALVSALTGIVQSLGSPWGLFKHYWVLTKFLLTIGATVILLSHVEAVDRMAHIAREGALVPGQLTAERVQLVVHAAGGLLVVLSALVLSIYKPWGLTPYGRRRRQESGEAVPLPARTRVSPELAKLPRAPRWRLVVGIHAVGLFVLLLVAHLLSGGFHGH
jgi:hypothetical protein